MRTLIATILLASFGFAIQAQAEVETLNPNELSVLILNAGLPAANSVVVLKNGRPHFVIGKIDILIPGEQKAIVADDYPFWGLTEETVIRIGNHYAIVISEAKAHGEMVTLDRALDNEEAFKRVPKSAE